MKEAPPTLLPLLRTRTQGDVLAWILLDPERASSLTEIADAVGTSAPTVLREVQRLEDAGLVTSMRRGNTRLVQARTDTLLYRPLADLMALTFGPIGVLRDALTHVEGIERAFIYGSWAARYRGEAGEVPRDIDLLIIGHPDHDDLHEAIEVAERQLRREVNARTRTAAAWEADDSPFKQTLNSRPIVDLIGSARG